MDLKNAAISMSTFAFVLSSMIGMGLGLRVAEIVTPLAIGACQQNASHTAHGPNNDPALRSTIVRQRRDVLHEFELQDVHEKIDRRFVLTHNQRH